MTDCIEKNPHIFIGAYLMGRGWDRDTARKFHQFIKIIGDYTLTTCILSKVIPGGSGEKNGLRISSPRRTQSPQSFLKGLLRVLSALRGEMAL